MFFHLLFLSEKHHAEKEKVNGQFYFGVGLNGVPSCLHPFRPVDVVKHKDTAVMGMFEAFLKIAESRFFAVIAVHKDKIQLAQILESVGEHIIERSFQEADIFRFHQFEVPCCKMGGIGATLDGDHAAI